MEYPSTNSNNLESCNSCDYCSSCYYCDYCYSCDSCYSCYSCYSCDSCSSCSSCYYCKNLRTTEFNIFCWSKKYNDEMSFQQKRYRAFNQEVGEIRYNKIVNEVSAILGKTKLQLFESWKSITKEQWINLSQIAEFDRNGVEYISGISLDFLDKPNLKGKTVNFATALLRMQTDIHYQKCKSLASGFKCWIIGNKVYRAKRDKIYITDCFALVEIEGEWELVK
jgi:hypothetical protein